MVLSTSYFRSAPMVPSGLLDLAVRLLASSVQKKRDTSEDEAPENVGRAAKVTLATGLEVVGGRSGCRSLGPPPDLICCDLFIPVPTAIFNLSLASHHQLLTMRLAIRRCNYLCLLLLVLPSLCAQIG